MKKLLIILMLLLLAAIFASAQGLMFSTSVEKTVAGYQYGPSLMYQTKGRWGLGAFYQTGIKNTEQGVNTKDPFYGAMIYAPLMKAAKMTFFFNLRAGMSNEKFFVVVPGLETQLQITRRIGAAFGMGLRMSYPSANARIYFKLF